MLKLTLLFTVLIFILAACGNTHSDVALDVPSPVPGQTGNGDDLGNTPDGEAPPDVDTSSDNDTPPDDEPLPDFALKFENYLIEMDQNISYVISALGEPISVFEVPSCAFDGIDRVFLYQGVQIHTYPLENDDFVHTISLRDDTISTTEGGVYLGLNMQSMLDAYGDDYEHESGMYKYTRGLTTLEFFIDDGVIMGITYGLILEQQ
jgi:hypothetical protein